MEIQIQKPSLPQRRVIGLDMHPDVFTAAALVGMDAADARVLWTHHRRPQQQLEAWLARHVLASDVIVIEASANTFAVVELIQRCGHQVVILESQKASQIRKSYCNNDRVSAVKLARIYLSGLATMVWKPDAATRLRREVFHAHQRAVKDTTRLSNRIKGFLNEQGIRLPRGFRLSAPAAERHLLAMKPWSASQQLILSQECQSLVQAQHRRRQLRSLMAREIVEDPKLLRVIRLFGLRHVTVYALAAFIGPIGRFRTPKQLVAYFGLNPSVNDSGNTSGASNLKRHGCAAMRGLLIQSAQAVLRHPGPLQKWALALSFRRGKYRAIVAIARKLTVACWYLLHGLFTPLEEVGATLETKLDKLVSAVGRDTVKAWGYSSNRAFKNHLSKVLLNTA